MKKKRICILMSEDIRHSYPTLKLLADELVTKGFEVDFFSRCLAFKDELESIHSFKVFGYVPRRPFSKIKFLIRGMIQVGRYDAYIGVLERRTILGRFLSKLLYNKPFIAYMPEVYPHRTWSGRLSINSLKHADAILDVDLDRIKYRSTKWSLTNRFFCINNVPSKRELEDGLKPVSFKYDVTS